MISLSHGVRVFLHTPATDLRKGFDALSGLVSTAFSQDPTSGHLFLFVNRRRDRLKILYWDRDGLAIWYKNQATDCPPTNWWNTPASGAHYRVASTASTCELVPGSPNKQIPRRLLMSGHTRVAVPPPRTLTRRRELTRFWTTLPTEWQQHALLILARIIARRLQAVPATKGVADDQE
jgi:IS66 Orf2 like protein